MNRTDTFAAYCTDRKGFGRTSWPVFAIIVAFVLLFVVLSIDAHPDPLWWIPALMSVAITTILVLGTWSNYETDKALALRPPSRNHYPDLCEGCKPPRMADGSPITDLRKWMAVRLNVSREDAWRIYVAASPEFAASIERQHAAYLNDLLK